MADNYTTNAGSGGATFRSLEDASSQHWPACVVAYATTVGTPDVLQVVTADYPLPVTAASLPLPSGAATAAAQTTGNASLSSIDGKLTACNTGAVVVSSGTITSITNSVAVTGTFWQATQPVSLASVPSHEVTIAAAQSIAVTNAGTFAVQAAQSGTWNVGTVTAVTGITNPVAVTGTFWQATQPVSLASVPSHEVTNAGTFAVQAAQSGTWNITNVSGTISLPTGAATESTLSTLNGKVTACNTGSIAGTVTANAGTNLNTSALALETGGNLAGAATSLAVIDDWDDGADRCKIIEAADVSLDGTTVATVKRFHVVTSTDGATVIAAVASKKFRIRSLAVFSTSTTATNVWFEDADGADVFGDSTGIPVDADGGSGPAGFVLGCNPDGWFQTATANKNLVVKLTAAQKVVIAGTYIEVS